MTPAEWAEQKRLQKRAKTRREDFTPNPSKRFVANLDRELEEAVQLAEAGGPWFVAMEVLERRAALMQHQTFQIVNVTNDDGTNEQDIIIHADHDDIDIGAFFGRMSAAKNRDGQGQEEAGA